ncbi:16S rRNA (cytosine(1402)-N(4))-methyltransferase RsmH [Candidatus Dojkabacteria bacterium]|uniref:Ribosomal RNA small subunit methyltransferase H n=1 Tax=Candidatus Dojkabacteria bacterium TaxID=2099670 RepID=A0A955I8T4_9BACT|nr:16S rRNA (cytosine(1402)-N(4))-methyltransferase RsmH [Candidatus Dojkabacteria bacterium]
MEINTKHIPVLINETIDLLNLKDNSIYVDATLGGGGYSQRILALCKNSKLISFEIDQNAYKNYLNALGNQNPSSDITEISKSSNTQYIVNKNFSELEEMLSTLKISKIDGLVADLGWSTDQLSSVEGMSFENESDFLDMRFNKNLGVTAADLLNALGKSELKKIFMKYGDFSDAESSYLVNAILEKRKRHIFDQVQYLNQVIESTFANAKGRSNKNINQTKARIYQSLRIAVNSEYDNLNELLNAGFSLLNKSGRIVIVTFHSGEAKIVEEFINQHKKELDILSKTNAGDYITPTFEEIKNNNKSRSAKLWAIEKL